MNRKLHNSMLAFSATGLMLVFALLAASPVQPGQDVSAPVALSAPAAAQVAGLDAAVLARAEVAKARAADIEARARELEAQLDRSASLGDTIASAVGFAAAVSTEAALSAALEAGDDEAGQEREQARAQRRHARQVRSALAVPYFSFAQGLRRGSRS
ncbi:MAG TPA: hypothetical protein VM619_15120 [Luteimonas sp.]|nr:hypothetical protein [Luteimonas sp.]